MISLDLRFEEKSVRKNNSHGFSKKNSTDLVNGWKCLNRLKAEFPAVAGRSSKGIFHSSFSSFSSQLTNWWIPE